MRLVGFFVLCGGILSLAACATLNENECQTVDWRVLGDAEGGQGFPSLRLAKHQEACERHQIPINREAYLAGWQTGITRFCTPRNGFAIGLRGVDHRDACPSALSGPFLAAYRPAKNLFDSEVHLEYLESKIDRQVRIISRLAESKDPDDLKRIKKARDDLKSARYELPIARADVRDSQIAANNYLRANPGIAADI